MRFELMENYYNGPDYLKALQARANTLSMLEKQPMMQARYNLDVFACDPVAFIETFGFIQIPEYNNAVKPFFMFQYQKDIIYKLQQSENSNLDCELLIDKPRGMGLTWIVSWYLVWRWLYTPNWSGFALSRTEAEVDDGGESPNGSIFGKLRWCIKHLPPWVKPEGFTPKGKKGTSTDSSLKLLNPAMGSSIIGSTTNANAGRSRRYSFIFIDECFAIERFNEVWRSLQSVARVKVFVSTVKMGKLYRDFKDYCANNNNYVTLTWKDNPYKDQQWYEEQLKKAEVDPEVMREVDPNYNVNSSSQYYPEISLAKVEDNIPYNRKLPLYISLDFGSQDKTVIIWYQWDGKFINVIETYCNSRKALDWYVPFLHPQIFESGSFIMNPEHYNEFQLKLYNKIKTWEKPKAYFGEPAHFQKVMPLNRSIAEELLKYQVRLMMNQYASGHEVRRHTTASLLPRTIFNQSSDYVMSLFDALTNSRYNMSIRSVTSKGTTMKPVHDAEIADYRAAFENGCVNLTRVIRGNRERTQEQSSGDPLIRNLVKYLRI